MDKFNDKLALLVLLAVFVRAFLRATGQSSYWIMENASYRRCCHSEKYVCDKTSSLFCQKTAEVILGISTSIMRHTDGLKLAEDAHHNKLEVRLKKLDIKVNARSWKTTKVVVLTYRWELRTLLLKHGDKRAVAQSFIVFFNFFFCPIPWNCHETSNANDSISCTCQMSCFLQNRD